MAERLEIRLLGGLLITLNGQPISGFPSRKTEALLAYLAMNKKTLARDMLANLLWAERSQQNARGNLRVSLTSLRRHVPSYVIIDRQTVALNLESDIWVDVDELEEKLASVVRQSSGPNVMLDTASDILPAEIVSDLEAGLVFYEGAFLADFSVRNAPDFDDWLFIERERLQQLVLRALHRLAIHYLATKKYEEGIRAANRLLQMDSLDEEAHQLMMLLRVHNNQRNAALEQYETCRQILDEEMGVPPSDETTLLYEQIRDGKFESETKPSKSLLDPTLFSLITPATPNNLPNPATSFFGREEELKQIDERLQNPNCRLLTLLGQGGMGKTRLAQQAAHQALDQVADTNLFTSGVYFISLAAISSAEYIPSAIAGAMEFSFQGTQEPKTQLFAFLRPKQALLVLDNFEHVMDGADLVLDILEAAAGIKILITSRERLNLRAEWLLELSGLSYSLDLVEMAANGEANPMDYPPAVALFQETATRVNANFKLSAPIAPYVIEICTMVNGLPLGIELAASLAHQISCQQIAQQVRRNLDILSTDMRDVPSRHRSLRAVFDHSWQLLNSIEREALRKLSVFRGGFTVEAAMEVAEATSEMLSELAAKSLIRQTQSGRYVRHQILYQYMQEKLAEQSTIESTMRKQHCRYYSKFVQQREMSFVNREAMQAAKEMSTDFENILSAWEYAVSAELLDKIDQMGFGLFRFYLFRGPIHECEAIVRSAIEQMTTGFQTLDQMDSRRQILLGKLLTGHSTLLHSLAEYDAAIEAAQSAIQLAEANQILEFEAAGYGILGKVLSRQGNYSKAHQKLEKSIEVARAGQAQQIEAESLLDLGIVTWYEGDYASARSYGEQALAIFREVGNLRGEARIHNNLGILTSQEGNYIDTRRHYEHALQISKEIGDRMTEGRTTINLGRACAEQGDYTAAEIYYEQALVINQEMGNSWEVGSILLSQGRDLTYLGNYADAINYYERALQLRREIGDRPGEGETLASLSLLSYHQGDYKTSLQQGQEAVAIARETRNRSYEGYALTNIGHALASLSHLDDATQIYQAALKLRQELGQANLETEPLAGLARIFFAQNEMTQAQNCIEAILKHLDAHTLDGTDDPFRVYITCYHVLEALDDPRANSLIDTAHQLLQERVAKINDTDLRHSFLDNVVAHREIVNQFEKTKS